MSVKIMGQVWDLELPAPKLLVLLALSDHADHNGNNVFPSVELVAWKTGYSESQARRIIKSLVKDGILTAQHRPGKTTLYSVHLEKGKQKEPFKRSNTGFQIDTPSTAMTPQGLHSYDTPTPSIAMTPEPSLEPSTKPSISSDDGKASPKPKKQRLVFNAIAEHVFELKDLSGVSGGRITNLEKVARRVITARLGELTDEEIALEVTRFAKGEKFKPGIQGVHNFELGFAKYLDRVKAKVIPLTPAKPTDLSEWHTPDPFDFLKSEGA